MHSVQALVGVASDALELEEVQASRESSSASAQLVDQ